MTTNTFKTVSTELFQLEQDNTNGRVFCTIRQAPNTVRYKLIELFESKEPSCKASREVSPEVIVRIINKPNVDVRKVLQFFGREQCVHSDKISITDTDSSILRCVTEGPIQIHTDCFMFMFDMISGLTTALSQEIPVTKADYIDVGRTDEVFAFKLSSESIKGKSKMCPTLHDFPDLMVDWFNKLKNKSALTPQLEAKFIEINKKMDMKSRWSLGRDKGTAVWYQHRTVLKSVFGIALQIQHLGAIELEWEHYEEDLSFAQRKDMIKTVLRSGSTIPSIQILSLISDLDNKLSILQSRSSETKEIFRQAAAAFTSADI